MVGGTTRMAMTTTEVQHTQFLNLDVDVTSMSDTSSELWVSTAAWRMKLLMRFRELAYDKGCHGPELWIRWVICL